MIGESKYLKVIRADQDEDINFLGDLVITQGILVKGELFIGFGSVYIKSGAIVKGNINVSICVYVGKEAKIIGEVRAFSVENRGEIKGNIDANFFKNFGTSTGNVNAKAVIIGEYGVHRGPIESMCVRIDKQGRHFEA